MDRRELQTLQGRLLWEGDGAHTGLEVMGDLPRLVQTWLGWRSFGDGWRATHNCNSSGYDQSAQL